MTKKLEHVECSVQDGTIRQDVIAQDAQHTTVFYAAGMQRLFTQTKQSLVLVSLTLSVPDEKSNAQM